MYYWSICWAGMVVTAPDFESITEFDIKINPTTTHKFTGPDLKFPFTKTQIKKEKKFGEVAQSLLDYLDPDTLVIGHAFINDAKMIIDSCCKYDIPCPHFDYIDTNELYNALTGESGERSLSKLAEKYEIEFTAHDPLEDARATLLVAKNISEGKLFEFLQKHEITPSTLKNNLIFKGGLKTDNKEQLQKLKRVNMPFALAADISNPNETFYFDSALLASQKLKPLLTELVKNNCSFTATPYSAQTIVTNNLMLNATPNTVKLRELVSELGLSGLDYNFAPKRIRDKGGKAITQKEYYDAAFKEYKKDGLLAGKAVSFTKTVEQTEFFEDMLKAIYSNGGKVCFDVAESDIFVVADLDELKKRGDGRLRHFRRESKKKKYTVYTMEQFNELLE